MGLASLKTLEISMMCVKADDDWPISAKVAKILVSKLESFSLHFIGQLS